MSTKTKEKDDKAPADGEEAKGGKKKILIIAVVALLAVGAALYFFVFSGSEAEAAPVEGTVLTLEPVAVNLAGGGYLKVGIALQFTEAAGGGGHGGAPDGSKALDLLISQFSQAQPADVTTARDALKADLQKKIIEAYHHDVMGIYFTEYVTQ
ncbi:flagellar basal body protein FliL [Modestobacter sp. I12A-02628]|uniref:Flagellar protein FliL n=1 Tax=Goekera deserti TaxID=2497753 RepID=A0A7K3WGP0_9ACTN|nr:flagellar basal body-associated FliL family protein [Goekera deserti]MPQ99491.1 flagellar basal body protein FliL [Goekera deserti]NDI48978.1 flagellar basal body protein FliL [Goekera deserti]NEL55552.1 flagellar basal body protein FliL [Goekera deserti]